MHSMRKMLKKHYNIDAENILPKQGGWASLAYQVYDYKACYFLKVYEKNRASTPKLTALIDQYVPVMEWLIHHSNLKGKIPVPHLTRGGDYKCEDEYGIYLLYDYIKGETIGNRDLTDDQVFQLSNIVTELHVYGEDIPMETDDLRDHFDVPFLQSLKQTLNKERDALPNDIRVLIHPYMKQIHDLVITVDKLSVRLKNSDLRRALCHTDLHYWNLMQSGQQLMLIDWEGLRLAPVEADLMFLVYKPYYSEFLRIYRRTHKHFSPNPMALRFYQGKRKLEDVWELIEQLLLDQQEEQERRVTKGLLKEALRDTS
ncbi:aminoglycoside phosphotransferase family protein [Paludifilum halophilum]|uniref:Kinase n=1 Tax=Paludifilum halophilum TaxID=1642702 RepID=A0A235B4E1_9BACL|nr:aminoglycoside phosphotransferase family protein [Paludifilum halophilum]OYD06829.1 kinase [Paludifilum halophilum]